MATTEYFVESGVYSVYRRYVVSVNFHVFDLPFIVLYM